MSSSNINQKLCYIPCTSCYNVLVVCVPSNNLFDTVTVRCQHCTNLWTMDMESVFESITRQHTHHQMLRESSFQYKTGSTKFKNNLASPENPSTERVVNPPPQKRHRAASLYNQFIREEIQRIKLNNPEVTHKEAFSTAAKNWSRFPHIHHGMMSESNNVESKYDDGSQDHFRSLQS